MPTYVIVSCIKTNDKQSCKILSGGDEKVLRMFDLIQKSLSDFACNNALKLELHRKSSVCFFNFFES